MTDSSQESQPNLVINLIMGTTSDKLQIRNILFWWIFDFLIRVLYYSNFLDSSGGKESTCSAGNTGDLGSVPGSGRCPGGGSGHPLPYSYLQNSMDRGARGLQSIGARSQTWLSEKHTQLETSVPGEDGKMQKTELRMRSGQVLQELFLIANKATNPRTIYTHIWKDHPGNRAE